MTAAAAMLLFVGMSVPLAYPSAEDSDKKLPADMENASTNTSTTPVRKIVFPGTVARAMPESSPTVETRLSSTPKIKFLKNDTERAVCIMAGLAYVRGRVFERWASVPARALLVLHRKRGAARKLYEDLPAEDPSLVIFVLMGAVVVVAVDNAVGGNVRKPPVYRARCRRGEHPLCRLRDKYAAYRDDRLVRKPVARTEVEQFAPIRVPGRARVSYKPVSRERSRDVVLDASAWRAVKLGHELRLERGGKQIERA